MNKNNEIELKFEVLDEINLIKFLNSLKYIDKIKISDYYFDTKNADLFNKGIFIRIRNKSRLDFKFNKDHFYKHKSYCLHDFCDELSFDMPLKPKDTIKINNICSILNLNKIKKADFSHFKLINNLIKSVIINKTRKSYTDDIFHYYLDNVKNLGKYLEIEYLSCNKGYIDEIKNKMLKKISNLKVKHINIGYNEIYYRKYNLNIYLKGLYLLEEDYKKYRIN